MTKPFTQNPYRLFALFVLTTFLYTSCLIWLNNRRLSLLLTILLVPIILASHALPKRMYLLYASVTAILSLTALYSMERFTSFHHSSWTLTAVIASTLLASELIYRSSASKRKAERLLQESEERYRTIVNNTSDTVWRLDSQGVITYISPSARRMFGHDPNWLVGQPLEKIVAKESQAEVHKMLSLIQGGLGAGDGLMIDLDFLRSDHTRLTGEVMVTLAAGAGDKPTEIVGVTRDVTERKLAEREQRKLEVEIQRAQKLESLSVLAGGVAHDFNNLLMAIVGNADLALLTPSPEAREKCFGEIQHAAQRAAELCRQMLAFSGKGHFVMKPICLNTTITRMRQILEAALPNRARVHYQLGANLPTVEADAAQIIQILMNLLINAAEAINEQDGTVTVNTGRIALRSEDLAECWLGEALAEGEYGYLEVSDTGCGMSPEIRKKIFEPFFTTKFTGRGLGMAAVLGITRGHNGAIRITSEPGRGTAIRIILPPFKQPAESLAPCTTTLDDDPGASSDRRTILVVDDEPPVREMTEDYLKSCGFPVLTASDGLEALEVYRQHRGQVGCVLLDMTMPRMSGEETFGALRQACRTLPVIISSGYSEQEIRGRFADRETIDFIQKPYRFDQLISTITKALSAN